jgi:hypothetical protein
MHTLACHGMKQSDPTKKYDKPRRETMIQHLLEYQFKQIDKTMLDTLKEDRWFYDWTVTSEQRRDFHHYAIPLIKKIFRCNRMKATLTYDWFIENFGLKVKDHVKSRYGKGVFD